MSNAGRNFAIAAIVVVAIAIIGYFYFDMQQQFIAYLEETHVEAQFRSPDEVNLNAKDVRYAQALMQGFIIKTAITSLIALVASYIVVRRARRPARRWEEEDY